MLCGRMGLGLVLGSRCYAESSRGRWMDGLLELVVVRMLYDGSFTLSPSSRLHSPSPPPTRLLALLIARSFLLHPHLNLHLPHLFLSQSSLLCAVRHFRLQAHCCQLRCCLSFPCSSKT